MTRFSRRSQQLLVLAYDKQQGMRHQSEHRMLWWCCAFVLLWYTLLIGPQALHAELQGVVQPLEAEKATLNSVQTATNHLDFTGTGFADYQGEGFIEWTFTVAEAGLYQVEFRYALATGDRPLNIIGTNGIPIKSNLLFPATGSFDVWKTVSVFAKLDAGSNTVRAVTAGSSGANIDHMVVSLTPPDLNRFLTFPVHTSSPVFRGSEANAQAYYQAIDPTNSKTTFDAWRAANGFPNNCGPASSTCFHAVYYNGADLGLGRSMYVLKKPNGDVASYVENFLTLEDAVNNVNKVATVAMEYTSPPGLPTKPKFTTFFVFQDQQEPKDGVLERVTSIDLDGRGKKFVPGLCNVCHGGKPKPNSLGTTTGYLDRGDTGAKWIPWDLDTYHFHPTKTRASQEEQFKKLNQTLLQMQADTANRKGVAVTSGAALLIKGWYGGDGLPNATFNGNFVPPGWASTSDGNKSALYLNVVGPTCRACHSQRGVYHNAGHVVFQGEVLEQSLEFNSYEDFKSYKNQIESLVYDMGVMPLAKRTFENFWRSDAPKILDNELFGGQVYQNPTNVNPTFRVSSTFGKFRRPGRPIPNIAGIPTIFGDKQITPLGSFCFQGPIFSLMDVPEGQHVVLNAQPSLFATQFSWSFVHPETGCTDFSGPALSGTTSSKSSFALDPGVNSDIKKSGAKPYHLRLSVTNEFAQIGSGFNEIIVGSVFSNSSLPPATSAQAPLTYENTIHPFLTTNFPSTRSSTPLSCVHCHSNGNVVNRADGVFNLMDFTLGSEEAKKEFAYRMLMTRVDCRDPENSLILKKPAGHHHFNGTVQGFDNLTNAASQFNFGNSGDPNNRAKILRWIMEGAKYDTAVTHRNASCIPLIKIPFKPGFLPRAGKELSPKLIEPQSSPEEIEAPSDGESESPGASQ